MRKLIDWLDLGHFMSSAAYVAAGIVGLAIVTGALVSSMNTTEPVTAAQAAPASGAVLASLPSSGGGALESVSTRETGPSISVPAVFRAADREAGRSGGRNAGSGVSLVHNAVERDGPAIRIDIADLEKERRCLTEGIYFEARGESSVGQLAVAEVILNRVTSGKYPNSICGVVFQGQKTNQCQFSFACGGDMKKPRDPVAWRKAQRLAHYVLAGKVRNTIVGSATYYHASYVSPDWAQHMVEVAKIGGHIFYRRADAPDPS